MTLIIKITRFFSAIAFVFALITYLLNIPDFSLVFLGLGIILLVFSIPLKWIQYG